MRREGVFLLGSPNFLLRGCVNPASWLPLTAGASFMLPLGEKYELQSKVSL